MNIKLARFIDYWAGIPICFIFDVINFILKPVSVLICKNKIAQKKLLFIKLSEMGSIVLAYPLLKKALDETDGAKLYFLTFEKNRQALEALNMLQPANIITIQDGSLLSFFASVIRAIVKIRSQGFDMVFDLELFSRGTAIISYLSAAVKRIGFYPYRIEGLYRGHFLTNRVQYNPTLHITKSYLSLWQAAQTKSKYTPELQWPIKDEELSLPRFITSQDMKTHIKNVF